MRTEAETGTGQPLLEADVEGEAAPESSSPRRLSLARLETRGKKLMAVVAALGVIVGLVAGVIELKDKLFPPPTPVVAELTPVPDVEADVIWEKARADDPELGGGSFTAAQLGTNGSRFTVKLKVRGESGETGHLTWRLLADGVELDVEAWVPRSIPVQPTTDEHEVAQKVWVPLPPGVEAFQAEFTYVDSGGTARDTKLGPRVELG